MATAVKTGLIKGLANGDLGMQAGTTRAQAVTVIGRVLKVKVGENLEVDQDAVELAEVVMTGTNFGTFGYSCPSY